MRISLYDAPKVEDVGWMKGGITSKGTVHLTAHHLIFRFDDAQQEEIWVSYLCH
jgi:myotubularin-related protein 6/7/8